MVRIWNLPVEELDNQHLLGEHLELHIIWNALTQPGRRGWVNHPETRRWTDRLGALHRRHEDQVEEMRRRGWTGHKSPLPVAPEVEPRLNQPGATEWPPVTPERVAKDREDLVAHFPGWRKVRQRDGEIAGRRESESAPTTEGGRRTTDKGQKRLEAGRHETAGSRGGGAAAG
ncbi:MAG: hypothetical protein HY329_12745 [Chloroflexi bacterium]|nr:hypothetical protein [Chloroflexota bacterium]